LWILRSKFNVIIEMIFDSDIHLSKLDGVLERSAVKTNIDFKSKTLNDQLS